MKRFCLVLSVGLAACGTTTPPLLEHDDASVDAGTPDATSEGSAPSSDAHGDGSTIDVSVDVSTSDGDRTDGESTEGSATDAPVDEPEAALPECTSGATRQCKDDPVRPAILGNCAAGTESCVGGHWGPCSVQPALKDSCVIGDDATCDGTPNKDCPCIDGAMQDCGPAAQVGICKRGKQTCTGSAWGMCMNAVFAKGRDCTSMLDNDCDGSPDATVDAVCQCAPNTSQACGAHAGFDGKGPCTAGSRVCVLATDRQSSAWGTCNGSIGPAGSDTCDMGNDSNCTGTANDGCQCINTKTQACGACGSQTCAAGAWGTCQQPAFGVGELKWPMPNATSVALHLPNPQSYDTTQSGRVLDKVTGLTWQRALNGTKYTQAQAVSYCTALILGGQGGWRLPSVIELLSIVDDTAAYLDSSSSTFFPAIDGVTFPNTPTDTFWTTTAAEGQSGENWTVSFRDGALSPTDVATTANVRCVR